MLVAALICLDGVSGHRLFKGLAANDDRNRLGAPGQNEIAAWPASFPAHNDDISTRHRLRLREGSTVEHAEYPADCRGWAPAGDASQRQWR